MSNNYGVFDFVYPNQNDSLSNLNKKDLKEFLSRLKKYDLEYRPSLNLKEKNSFGLEIECDHISWPVVSKDLNDLGLKEKWHTSKDSSLDCGVEAISPVLNDSVSTWEDVYKVCDFLDKTSYSLDKAAAHVHAGAHTLETREAFVNLLRIWSTYENVIFRFGFGERMQGRELIEKYSCPVSSDYWNKAHTIERFNLSYYEIVEILTGSRYKAVNFNNLSKRGNMFREGNTVEFRCANGTLNPVIWQNLVSLYTNMLNKSNCVDEDIIMKRHNMMEEYLGNYELYDEIFLDQALEFADLIFDNNIDKVYFLSQYFKGFSHSKKDHPLTKILTINH